MNIIFSGKYALNDATFGINFEALVNGQIYICSILGEALQDIDPSNAQCSPEQQFLANKYAFQGIAEKKILAGAKSPVLITSADV